MIRKTEMNYIIELLRCAISNDRPCSPPEGIDWEQIFIFAKKHKILPTLYFGIQKLPAPALSLITHLNQYQLAYKMTLVQDANRTAELKKLKKSFENNKIDYIFLKGSVTKYLYPDTSMRVMNDIDIFYRKAGHKLIQEIFRQNNYTLIKKEPKELVFTNIPLKIKVEMQTQLVDEGYEIWFKYLENIWDRCISSQNRHEYKMTDEDFYIYHIIHMAKHFKNGGIGLTHVLDIWIMITSYSDLNQTYIKTELTKLKLNTFEQKLRALVLMWFEEISPDRNDERTLELLGNYIFASGAFGIKPQQEINKIVAGNDNKVSLLKKIFPSRSAMVDYYGSIIKNHPCLIPFYWIRLNFRRLFYDRKNVKTTWKIMNKISDKTIKQTRELMDKLEL